MNVLWRVETKPQEGGNLHLLYGQSPHIHLDGEGVPPHHSCSREGGNHCSAPSSCYTQTSSRLFPGPSGGSLAESVPCEAHSTRRLSIGAPGCLSLLAQLLLQLDLLAFVAAVVVGVGAAANATVAGVLTLSLCFYLNLYHHFPCGL